MSDFLHDAIRELTHQQVRYAPPPRRQEQLARAEQLLRDIDPAKRYPYQFICFWITDYRSDAYPDLVIPGHELQRDLQQFVLELKQSLQEELSEPTCETLLTLEQVSKQFKVSTKTISRWRVRGLIGHYRVIKGRRQIVFVKSMVEQFLVQNQEHVERSARFSHLRAEEKEEILRRARRLARVGGSLMEVSKRIARKLKRSVEAVRYTIKNFDRNHPDQAIFPETRRPLDEQAKEMIANSYDEGVPVEALARKYQRTRTPIYNAINQVRAKKPVKPAVDYIYHESFDDPAQEADILAPMPDEADFLAAHREMKPPRDVPSELASLYEWPLLTKAQEQHQFRLMNFLKHRLHTLLQAAEDADGCPEIVEQVAELQAKIKAVKERLINCNMRLVASIAKKHAFQAESLFDLISDGNISLMRAVDKFDYSRGNKFSTYASWAIMKNFARSIPDEKHHRERFVTGSEELFEAKADVRTDEQECLAKAELARDRLNQLLEGLDPRTREVIIKRNGLDGSEEMTLEQIGQHFGITKERVRQINVRGMKILRERAMAEQVDLP